MKTISILGCGARGHNVYGSIIKKDYPDLQIKYLVEKKQDKFEDLKKFYDLNDDDIFNNTDDFFAKGKICDAVIIATDDASHNQILKQAIKIGYDILLEKPIVNKPEDVEEIDKISKNISNKILVCHVLRYTRFFEKIKELLNGNAIGNIISIQHNENIGYWHFAHSFVRGNWRNKEQSSPLILSKSCHDLDILIYLTGKKIKKVSAFGGLKFFNKKNKPFNSKSFCHECPLENECIFSAKKIYNKKGKEWENFCKENKDYTRCVFDCDNNVADHMSMILGFEDDISAVFNLCAFSKDISRTIKIMGTKGEIGGFIGDYKNHIKIKYFGQEKEESFHIHSNGGHSGGDNKIIEDFYLLITGGQAKSRTTLDLSIQSHLAAFAIEKSMLENKVVFLK